MSFITGSPAELAILMALIQVVLKRKTSTTYQSRIYELIDLNFGKVDNVMRSTHPAKFGKDRFSSGAPTWWLNIQVACLFYYHYFCFVIP